MTEGAIEFHGAKVRRIAQAPLAVDKDGLVTSDPQIDVTLRIDWGVFRQHHVRLGNAWARQADLDVRLDFPEQLELEGVRKTTAANDGHDEDADHDVGGGRVTPIGGKRTKKVDKEKARA